MRLSRRYLWTVPLAAGLAAGGLFLTQRGTSAPSPTNGRADQPADLKPAVNLPISQVVLFNSGVGHFTRSGEVEGDARIDLTFPEQDVNDLIKSMTLRDFSPNGKVAAVTYDSHDPIDRTLASFAINLNHSPSLAQILTQARGEQVEVALLGTSSQPGNLVGKIMGVEQQLAPSKDGPPVPVTILNLWCAEGLRAIKLSELQRLRFANPVIENEIRRALETLAMSHDAQKKAVSLHFSGEGKRKVEVGYVVENPIWKTSYRLGLAKDADHKPFLQGWAVVENPTDEDWQRVTMALVSGRPISFKMDLYNPLYVARPTVEPELFASLRPPTYGGAILDLPHRPTSFGIAVPAPDASPAALGIEAPADKDKALKRAAVRGFVDSAEFASVVSKKLNEDLELGRSVQSVASASALGDYYRYVIDRPVDLARQKSALLPIVNMDVEGKRVSIYNPAVQPKHPLLGLRFKNTTGMPLTQGPVTVFEGSVYAGDTRVMDLQPDEERLVSYAIDLGTEVAMKRGNNT
ncbi:MAG TPA: DUF4139 domain-containing protein, partial [Gemmataceae bacterium]|nr:DUF4139 domain-containing protein [Gemmataceae bacterium]